MSDSARALFGMETEYAVTALDGNQRVLPIDNIVQVFRERAATRPHLPGNEGGVFLGNGARYYIDVGSHPEYAAPETTNPWDAVRFALAGDRLMAQLADEVAREVPSIASLVVRKGNIDYGTHATWASHENYLHRRLPAEVRPALVSHLISRIVCTGGGGLDPFDDTFAQFVLSPRVLFIRRLIASSTPGDIALVDQRSQPHCAGSYRQHLMCGDANQSYLSLFLRIATTALVIGLIDAGCDDGAAVTLSAPLTALTTVTRDVTLRKPLQLASGQPITAIGIQRHYLRQVRTNLSRLPHWAATACDVWEGTLDRLDRGPAAVADRLDWAIKHAVYRDRAARRRRRWRAADRKSANHRSSDASGRTSAWRAELCEIDLRFGQVHPPGLFDALDRAGVLRHRVEGIHDIDGAVTAPPADGRAAIRGSAVAQLASRSAGVLCGWAGIRDAVRSRVLDLSDPFASREMWREFPAEERTAHALVTDMSTIVRTQAPPTVSRSIRPLARRFLAPVDQLPADCSGEQAVQINNLALDLRNAGRLEDAEWLMRAALAIDLAVRDDGHPKVRHRRNNLGTVLLMQGRVAEAREQIALAWQQTGTQYDLTSARILTMRLAAALVDGEPWAPFIGQLKSHLDIQPLPDFADVDRHWQIGPVLHVLAPRLDAEALDLLKTLAAVLNGTVAREWLDTQPGWRTTPAHPLDVPWPPEAGQ